MNEKESIAYIKQIQIGAAIKPGLDTIANLLHLLGNPQDRTRFIHLAGTNGKGSTATFLTAMLAASGRRVGRFVSPAVFSQLEKVQYCQGEDTTYITEEEFASCVTQIRTAIDQMQRMGQEIPTEFEIDTAVAFMMFEKWQCDVVVLETGMGGRLDATNIVKTVDCEVITPIAMDHMKFLGDTIEKIAAEKAGIIKPGSPVVVWREDATVATYIENVCVEKNASVTFVESNMIQVHQSNVDGNIFSYGGFDNLKIPMCGQYQVENACLALTCLQVLHNIYPVSEEEIRLGLQQAKWPGRFDVMAKKPWIVADGAHNPQGTKQLLRSLDVIFPNEKKWAVMGVFADKDYPKMCKQVCQVFERIITVTPPGTRGLEAERLVEECGKEQKQGLEIGTASSVSQALDLFMASGRAEVIVVFGSLSLMKETYDYVAANHIK